MERDRSRLIITLLSVLLITGVAIWGSFAVETPIFLNEPLAGRHTLLMKNCGNCHTPWQGVSVSACIKCHEDKKHGSDTGKIAECFDCHREHRGREHNLVYVEDSQCGTCHESQGHPRRLKGGGKSGRSGIRFSHLSHMENEVFDKTSCDTCHAVGKNGLIAGVPDFEEFCSSCHVVEEHSAEAEDTGACASCHTNKSYRLSEKSAPPSMLESQEAHVKHTGEGCSTCHRMTSTGAEGNEIIQADASKCYDCHKKRQVGADCVSCHAYHP